jgi:DNA polymerase-3 subunit delta
MANARGGARSKGGRQQRLDARAVEALLTEAAEADDAICVVSGGEEALRRLVVERLLTGAGDADATVVRVSARDAGAATAIEHAGAPALFGGATWLLLEDLDAAADDVQSAAKDALAAAGPDLRVLLSHGGAPRGKGVVTAAQRAGARVLEARPIAAAAVPSVLSLRARQHHCTLGTDAARAIVETIGEDVTALLAAVDQLASDSSDGRIDVALVRSTFPVLGNENQFEVADLVWHRKAAEALTAFRGLADRNGVGNACVTVVAALSYSLRSLARYTTEQPTGSPWQVASALGVPPWKVDALAAQSRLWRPGQLAAAAVALADADADAKGGLGDTGALDPGQKMYAVEQLIVTLATGFDQPS